MDKMDPKLLEGKGLGGLLGIKYSELTPERVVATMPITPELHQPFGYLHGGASVVLAETVASVGAFLNCPSGKIGFGMEINANHLRPKRDGVLTAIATPLHRGQSSHVWEIKIIDDAEKLICVSRCTVAIVDVPGAKLSGDPKASE